ncbi:uncharacterized protein LOC141671829 isoform X2 [Apium graveolens]|uniref:uncharacterized protein LOC141671829 isoform X2 n=1 Tax=Apium graveolens TaxID=4045 RepID=UPI003D7A84AB
MDFHNMKRKELQKLCKNHNLPANLSNLEMVDKLSSLFKVQEAEKGKRARKTRSCLKNSDEMLSENESDVLKKNVKKVRFSPENDVVQLGEKSEKGFVAENKGGAGRVTRGRASLLCKTVLISPVVMKRKGKRAVQEVEKEDLVVENKGGASRVSRARASLGKNVVISSPVVMKKRAKRTVQEVEKKDLDVESKGGLGRVTRTRALVDEKVSVPSPVVMKKKGKKAVQQDVKEESVSENQGGASRVTRARAGKQVLMPSPVVMEKIGKQAVQENEEGDLVVENKGGASRVTRARAGKQVLISSPVVMKKRGERAVLEDKKKLRNRKVENVASPKNIVRNRNTQKRSQSIKVAVLENKDANADGGITQPKMGLRRSAMTVNISEESEGLMDETDQKVSRKNSRQTSRQRASAKSSVEDVDKKTVAVEISQPEVVTRQSKRNRQLTDESTMYQTRRGTKRMSVMPQMKKAKMEKPVAGNLGTKNIVVKDSPNESTKPVVVEKGSETGQIAEDSNGSGTNSKTVTTKKRRRDAVPEEVPLLQTGTRANRKADYISDKLKEETPVASEPRTRSANREASLMHSAKKLNVSGNLGPSRTAGEKSSPHHTRELSTVPKHSATGARQSKTVAVTPRSRSGGGQKPFTHTTKKLRRESGNSGLHSSIGDKESPHHSREIPSVPRRSETESKERGSKSKHTLVIHEHSRRFTRSALKGKTGGLANVRGKIHQKSQSVSKLPLSKVESSVQKAICEGPLDIDVQSSYQEDRSTVNIVSNASDLPEDKTACSTPQGSSPKTSSVGLNLQKSEGLEMINIHEVSPATPSNLQSNNAGREVDISTQGGSPKTTRVDLNVQESEGHEMMNVCEASPFDPLNLQSSYSEIEVDVSTPQGGSPKTSVDLNLQALEGPELKNIHEVVIPSDPLNLQSNHAELEVDISTAQVSSPKTSSVDLNVQQSEGQELINIGEASPGVPLNVQSNYVDPEEDISTPQGDSPTSRVDLNVQESEGPKSINICEASTSDTLSLQIDHAVYGHVNEDYITATQRENFSETNVASPHLVNLEADAAAVDGLPADNALADISLVEQSTLTRTEERPQLSNDVESISKGIDLNSVFQGPTVHEVEPVYQSTLPADNSVTGKIDAACMTQQKGEIDARSPPLDSLKSEDNIDIIGDAGSIDTGFVEDHHLNAEHLYSSAFKETQEASKNVDHVVAEESTVNEEKLTAEVGDFFPTEEVQDIHNNSAVFAENAGLDNDCRSASKEVGEGNFADLTVSMICKEEKDDTVLLEISQQAVERHNTSSKSEMREMKFSVPNSILNTEEVQIQYEFSKPEFSDTVTGTVMCSNQEVEDDSNQRLSAVDSCLIQEESCTNERIELSASKVVADSVAIENKKSEPEVGGLDKDCRSVSKEVGEGNFSDLTDLTVSVICKEEKDDTVLPEISQQAVEQHNTSSKSEMREMEFSVPNSILNTEEQFRYEFSKPDFSDTVMCSNKEVEDYSNQSLSAVESCLIREESCRNEFIELSASKVVADSVAKENKKSEPEVPSSPSCATKVDNLVVEVTEDSPSNWSSDSFERTAVGGISLQNEQISVISAADVSAHNRSKNAKDENEISKQFTVFDSSIKEMSGMPEFNSSLPSHVTEVGHLVAEVKEMKPEDSPSLWSTENVPRREADSPSLWSTENVPRREAEDCGLLHQQRSSVISTDGSEHSRSEDARNESEIGQGVSLCDSTIRELTEMPEFISISKTSDLDISGGKCTENELSSSIIGFKKMVTSEVGTELINKGEGYSAVGIERREVEDTVFEDTAENDSERTSSMFAGAYHISDSQLPTGRESVLEETMCFSGDVEERRMNKNINRERTPVISEDDGHEFPSIVDHCHVPSEDSCGKEQGTNMSMVKSSKNFGIEFFSQHDYGHGSSDNCGKEQGTPMSIVKSSKNFGEEISGQHDKIIEQVKVCSAAALPQNICEDFAGFGNEMVADLMGSTIKQRTSDFNNENFEETEPCTMTNEKTVFGDGIESLKQNSPNLSQNLAEDSEGYCEKLGAEIITRDVSEEDHHGKDTIDSHGLEESLQQFNVKYGEIDSSLKWTCQDNDKRPTLVQMDVDTSNVESSRDNIIAGATVHRIDQEAGASGVPTEEYPIYEDAMDAGASGEPTEEYPIYEDAMDAGASGVPTEEYPIYEDAMDAGASGVPTEEFPIYEDAMDVDAPARLQYGGKSVTLTGENEAQVAGVTTEELTKIKDAMDADAPSNLHYSRESLTITEETTQAEETGSGDIISFPDIFGSELDPKSDEVGVDREKSHIWFDGTSFMLDKSEDAVKELDMFMVSATKEQLHNSGEEHVRAGNQQTTAMDNPSTEDDNVPAEISEGLLIESQLESEANKDAHQKVDCYNNKKSDENFTGTES